MKIEMLKYILNLSSILFPFPFSLIFFFHFWYLVFVFWDVPLPATYEIMLIITVVMIVRLRDALTVPCMVNEKRLLIAKGSKSPWNRRYQISFLGVIPGSLVGSLGLKS